MLQLTTNRMAEAAHFYNDKEEEMRHLALEDSEDDISVGCPSPVHVDSSSSPRRSSSEDEVEAEMETRSEEYFKPLMKLKMKIDKTSYSISERSKHRQKVYRHRVSATLPALTTTTATSAPKISTESGVKSFSICDILSHKPKETGKKIVRPWDAAAAYPTPPPAHTGFFPQPLFLSHFPHHALGPYPLPPPPFTMGPKSGDISSNYEESSSPASSTAGSDCCTSPDVVNRTRRRPAPRRAGENSSGKAAGKSDDSSPLDALFQMTSKTFDELNNDSGPDGSGHLNLFSNRQQPKKKRKSRTAFTNQQIFELERRFIYQKYLSPADRDEIAAKLGLSNAQVITWFQNRRAKLKRDMEELKKDVECTKVMSTHASFLENVQNLGILKKKPSGSSAPPNAPDAKNNGKEKIYNA